MSARTIKLIAACLALLGLAALAAGCGRGETRTAGARNEAAGSRAPANILVASASDMKLALPEIAAGFEKRTNHKVRLTLGSSGLLARQIEEGAPFDVYISANKGFIDGLAKKGLVTQEKRYARGLIVLIGEATAVEEVGGSARLEKLGAANIKNVAVANPETAPYGAAAAEALKKAGLWQAVEGKLVIAESIAHAYDFADTGNADAGIVALSLVKTTGERYAEIDPDLYSPIDQWAGIVDASASKAAARDFTDYLRSPAARTILEKYGFETAGIR